MTAITGGLITLEYAAEGVHFDAATVGQSGYTARDADLTTYVQAATPVIENIVGAVVPVSFTKRFNGGVNAIVLPGQATAITSLTVNGVVSTDYLWDSTAQIIYAGLLGTSVFASGQRLGVTITYTVGYTTVPATIQLATRELVRFWWEQGKQAQVPAFNDGVEAGAWIPQGFAVPKRVMELLAPYRKIGGFA